MPMPLVGALPAYSPQQILVRPRQHLASLRHFDPVARTPIADHDRSLGWRVHLVTEKSHADRVLLWVARPPCPLHRHSRSAASGDIARHHRLQRVPPGLHPIHAYRADQTHRVLAPVGEAVTVDRYLADVLV